MARQSMLTQPRSPKGRPEGAAVTDKFPRATAYHEAGHAVVAWLFGLPVSNITIKSQDASGGTDVANVGQLPTLKQVAFLAAGYTAERVFQCEGHQWMALDDHAKIMEVLNSAGISTNDHPAYIAKANSCAADCLQKYRDKIRDL